MESLSELIFRGVGFDTELKRKALEKFPGGVVAAMRAYLKISKKMPEWNFSVPSLELDKKHSVDLMAVCPEDGRKCFFDIKGKIVYTDVKIYNITSEDHLKKSENIIDEGPCTKDQKSSDLSSIYRLHKYIKGQREKGEKVFAYLVLADSNF